MSADIQGRCLCGSVVITITPPTQFCAHCHCESCRRAHAAALVTWTGVEEGCFSFSHGQELVQKYESSPGAFRCFCRTCGTSIYSYYTAEHKLHGSAQGTVYIPVAILTDPLDRPPDRHLSFEEHVSWFEFVDNLPRYWAKTDRRLD